MTDIDVIIDHIQKQGCNVRVMKGRLVLSKEAKGSIAQLGWAIPKIDLDNLPTAFLLELAERKIAEIDKHIAETEPSEEEMLA